MEVAENEDVIESIRSSINQMCSLCYFFVINRTAYREDKTSDNVDLSDVIAIIAKWLKSSSRTPKSTVGRAEFLRLKGLGEDLAHDYEILRASISDWVNRNF